MSGWHPTIVDEKWDVPENVPVLTKIEDEHGERNVQKLKRMGNLWFFRHGGATMMERAFDGFTALPPPDDIWSILGTNRNEIIARKGNKREAKDWIQFCFRTQARHLAETGGDMDRLVKARDRALEEIGG